jgi:hypothetical protein
VSEQSRIELEGESAIAVYLSEGSELSGESQRLQTQQPFILSNSAEVNQLSDHLSCAGPIYEGRCPVEEDGAAVSTPPCPLTLLPPPSEASEEPAQE